MGAKDVLQRNVGKTDPRVSYRIYIYACLAGLEIIEVREGARIVAIT
jgi:hypothetical protein